MKYGIFGKIQVNRERQPQRAAAFLILWYDLHFPVMVYNRISTSVCPIRQETLSGKNDLRFPEITILFFCTDIHLAPP